VSGLDKIKNKGQELVGKAKEVVGNKTNDEDLEAEGQADQLESDVKDVGEKLKDKLPD